MVEYVRIRFKGGSALLAAAEFDATKHELFVEEPAPEPEPEPNPDLPAPKKPAPRRTRK